MNNETGKRRGVIAGEPAVAIKINVAHTKRFCQHQIIYYSHYQMQSTVSRPDPLPANLPDDVLDL